MSDFRKKHEETLLNVIKDESDDKTAEYIVYAGNENDTSWVPSSMTRLEEKFDKEAVKSIRQKCQCGHNIDEKYNLVKEIFDESTSLQEFGNDERAISAGLFIKDNILHLKFPFCTCPILADIDKLESDAWCHCTTGYSKVLFEKLFRCSVKVDLLQSVKMGDEKCLMSIVPEDDTCFDKTK